MTELECFFSGKGLDAPYCRQLLSYDISGGTMVFNGYFHAEDEKLPLQCTLCLSETAKEPYKIENSVSYYKYLFHELYLIEIHRREFLEDTSEYSEEIESAISSPIAAAVVLPSSPNSKTRAISLA